MSYPLIQLHAGLALAVTAQRQAASLTAVPAAGGSINALAAGLPIAEILPQALQALDDNAPLVLRAPPGAGKTTVLPLAMLLREPAWLGPRQRIVVRRTLPACNVP